MSHSRNFSPAPPSLWPQAPSETFSPAVVLCFQASQVFSRWVRVAVCISSTGSLSLFKHFKPLPQHTRPPLPAARTLQVRNWEASPGEPGVQRCLPGPRRCPQPLRRAPLWHFFLLPPAGLLVSELLLFLQSFYEPGLQPWG